jgi:hypothetical protein
MGEFAVEIQLASWHEAAVRMAIRTAGGTGQVVSMKNERKRPDDF